MLLLDLVVLVNVALLDYVLVDALLIPIVYSLEYMAFQLVVVDELESVGGTIDH